MGFIIVIRASKAWVMYKITISSILLSSGYPRLSIALYGVKKREKADYKYSRSLLTGGYFFACYSEPWIIMSRVVNTIIPGHSVVLPSQILRGRI